MTLKDALPGVTGGGAAVLAYWVSLAGGIQPPDADSAVFLTIVWLCGAAVLTGLMLVFRARLTVRILVPVLVLAACLGTGALFRYEHQRSLRVADVRLGAAEAEQRLVTDILSPQGLVAVRASDVCADTEILDPDSRQVTFDCARRAADRLSGADDALFDAAGRRESLRVLVLWYRTAALGLMLALFLAADLAVLAAARARRATP